MLDRFIHGLLEQHAQVTGIHWQSDDVVLLERKDFPPFQAAILRQRMVNANHIFPFIRKPISVVANFPKIGKWHAEAIDLCEAHKKAWGQWGVLMRAINTELPETTEDPKIAFSRRALRQHNRVLRVNFEFDHLLIVHHDSGHKLKVALLYQYDLTGNDVREAWDEFGCFDILLKTNPNGSILDDAYDVASALGTQVFGIRETLSYLGKGCF